MSASTFRINQPPGSGYTYWDRARRDLDLGSVECEAQNTSESSYLWEIISAPAGETIVITNPTSSTCSFTISTRYGYLVRLTVNSGEIDESQTTLYFGIPLENSNACLPAFNETNQDNSQSPYNGERGFEDKLNNLFVQFDGGFAWQYDDVDDFLSPLQSTTGIRIGDGTVSNPALGFISDEDTGLYLPSYGILSCVANGAETFRTYFDTGNPVLESQDDTTFHIRHNKGTATDLDVESVSSANSATSSFHSTGSSDATTNVKAESSAGNAIVNVEANGTDASSYVNLGGDHCKVTFTDYLRSASTYSTSMPFSNSSSEWDNFETDFGEVSLLNSLHSMASDISTLEGDVSSLQSMTLQDVVDNGNSVTFLSASDPPVSLSVADSTSVPVLSISETGSNILSVSNGPDDGVRIGLGGVDGKDNNHIIITSMSNASKDHGLDTLDSEPSLFLFSHNDPTVSPDEYWKIRASSGYATYEIGDSLIAHNFSGTVRFNAGFSQALIAANSSSGVQTLNFRSANFYYATVDENITGQTITNPLSSTEITLKYTSSGSYSVGGFSGWKWDGASPPFAMTNGDVMIIEAKYISNTYYAKASGMYS
jgi:hypothetical protein